MGADLLHLKPNSTEAKEFEGFAKDLKGNVTTTSPVAAGSTGGNFFFFFFSLHCHNNCFYFLVIISINAWLFFITEILQVEQVLTSREVMVQGELDGKAE